MRKVCLPLFALSLFTPVMVMAQNKQDKVQKQNTPAVSRPVITRSAKDKTPGDKKTNQKNVIKNKYSDAMRGAVIAVQDGDGTGGGGDDCTLIAPTISGGVSICPGNDATMSAGNITGGSALQWQSSPVNDPNSFTNINGATSISYTAMNVVTTTYYRAKLSGGTCSVVSSTIQVTVTEAPINLVINDPAPGCSPSMVNLAASGITAGSEPGLYFFYFDANNNPLVSSLVSTGGTYYIEAYRNTTQTGCSTRKPVSVTINTQQIWVQDIDKDGYYGGDGIYLCPPLIPSGIGWTLYTNQQPGDCDDFNASVHPGATEICDNIDNNCNGQVDENGANVYYLDADGDGFGNPANSTTACAKPAGYSNNNTDCNDNNPLINPNTVWINDSDQDGYYSGNPVIQCASPGAGYFIKTTQQGGDCNDNDATVHSPLPYYLDNDDDGYGAGNAQLLCSSFAPEGYSTTNNDCDDTDDLVYPGAPEICDGKDNDCDGQIDEGVKTFFYKDNDSDGFGNAADSKQACTAPAGYVDNNIDCNDNNASVNPGAIEQCGNGVDDDCDGLVDESCGNLAGIFVTNTVVIEGNQGTRQANFVLLLNKRSSVPVTVKYETVNGSATAPQDYIAKSGTITFPANSILQNLKIDIVGDATNEANETFRVKLSQPVNGNLINTNGSCVILNDDLVPLAKVKDTTVLENQGTVKLRITLSAPSGQTVKVKYSTRNGPAIAPNDYTAQENILVTFAPGVTNMYATIPVVFDYINEPAEYFKVKIVSAENALLNTATRKGKVSITNVSRNSSHRDNQLVIEIKGTDTKTAEQANPPSNKLVSHEPASVAVQAWPNPTTESFTINIQSDKRDAVSIRVHDVQGRLVLILDKVMPNSSVKIGKEWGGGLYFAEVVQGDQRRTIKLVKQN